MRCLVVQHAEPEPPGVVGLALASAGVDLDVRRVHAGGRLPPDLSGLSGILVMGGPMSAHLDDGFPTRAEELALLERAVAAGVPVMGVCLGAQLLALATGGEVFAGEAGPEIGWGPVTLSADAADDRLFGGLPSPLTVLHWHGDTFRLGPEAVLLASSDRYRAQAFRVGENAWGLQFHVEVDEPQVEGFLAAFPEDAERGLHGVAGIRQATGPALAALAPHAALLADRFAGLVVHRSGRSEG